MLRGAADCMQLSQSEVCVHVQILIFPERITPRVPKMRPWPTPTLIKQRAPGKDTRSLSKSNLISVHELLWGVSPLQQMDGWIHHMRPLFNFPHQGWTDHLLIPPLLPPFSLQRDRGGRQTRVWAPDPCLSQRKPKLFCCLVPPDVAAPWMGSVWPGQLVCKGISGLPWHDSGILSRNSCVSPCFITSCSPLLTPPQAKPFEEIWLSLKYPWWCSPCREMEL